eukprot:gene31600-41030_t
MIAKRKFFLGTIPTPTTRYTASTENIASHQQMAPSCRSRKRNTDGELARKYYSSKPEKSTSSIDPKNAFRSALSNIRILLSDSIQANDLTAFSFFTYRSMKNASGVAPPAKRVGGEKSRIDGVTTRKIALTRNFHDIILFRQLEFEEVSSQFCEYLTQFLAFRNSLKSSSPTNFNISFKVFIGSAFVFSTLNTKAVHSATSDEK